MKNYFTLSDYNYLYKGIALYKSLESNCKEEFVLHYLCTDKKSFEKLTEIKSIFNFKIEPFYIEDCGLEKNEDTYYCTNQKAGKLARCFFFSLAARGIKYLFEELNIKDVFYIDSDIFFLKDIEILHEELKSKDVGIFPHLHNLYPTHVGAYNVGVIFFRNNDSGNRVLDFWIDCIMNSDNFYRNTGFDTCGDQKYLELFEVCFPKSTHIFGDFIVHGAPYNFSLFGFLNFEKKEVAFLNQPMYQGIDFKNKKFLMPFVHFMGFLPNFENDSYEVSNEPNNQGFINDPLVKLLYNNYYVYCKKICLDFCLTTNNEEIFDVKYS